MMPSPSPNILLVTEKTQKMSLTNWLFDETSVASQKNSRLEEVGLIAETLAQHLYDDAVSGGRLTLATLPIVEDAVNPSYLALTSKAHCSSLKLFLSRVYESSYAKNTHLLSLTDFVQCQSPQFSNVVLFLSSETIISATMRELFELASIADQVGQLHVVVFNRTTIYCEAELQRKLGTLQLQDAFSDIKFFFTALYRDHFELITSLRAEINLVPCFTRFTLGNLECSGKILTSNGKIVPISSIEILGIKQLEDIDFTFSLKEHFTIDLRVQQSEQVKAKKRKRFLYHLANYLSTITKPGAFALCLVNCEFLEENYDVSMGGDLKPIKHEPCTSGLTVNSPTDHFLEDGEIREDAGFSVKELPSMPRRNFNSDIELNFPILSEHKISQFFTNRNPTKSQRFGALSLLSRTTGEKTQHVLWLDLFNDSLHGWSNVTIGDFAAQQFLIPPPKASSTDSHEPKKLIFRHSLTEVPDILEANVNQCINELRRVINNLPVVNLHGLKKAFSNLKRTLDIYGGIPSFSIQKIIQYCQDYAKESNAPNEVRSFLYSELRDALSRQSA